MPKKIPVKVQKPSGFSKSCQNILTSKVGTITPIFCDELMPNTKVDIKAAISGSLPPLAFDTFMRCSVDVQAFFVPTRLLVGSYEDFFTGQTRTIGNVPYKPVMPFFRIADMSDATATSWINSNLGPGTLADYLGIRGLGANLNNVYPANPLSFSLLPFLAYHRIYEDWFRNTLVQKPVFGFSNNANAAGIRAMPNIYFSDQSAYSAGFTYTQQPFLVCDDSVLIFSLRQRNFKDDYFTIAMPDAQDGNAQKVTIVNNEFTIGALRGANALQRYAERHELAGTRYVDRLHSDYNANLSSGIAQRAILLGSTEIELYSKGIYQNSNDAGASPTNNPFASVGSRYGDAYAAGQGNLVNHFTAEEPGYLMIVAELVPRVTYASGINPCLNRYVTGDPSDIADLANPMLQGTGNEAIDMKELSPILQGIGEFGYTERYAKWKTKFDECHGLVRDGESLSAMCLQRSFNTLGSLTINSSFIEIPTDYLDQVTAVTAATSNYGYWLDCFFDYKAIMPLAPYSIPCLEDSAYEHQDDVSVRVGGSRVD